jgi:cobalt-zinc-cadmium efflux system membrane fusion protein
MVIDVSAVRGQQVAPEGAPVATVADPGRLRVEVQIPEALVAQVRVGSPVEVSGFSGARLARGTISHLTPDIDPHTRTGRARIQVADGSALRPGMYVQAAIAPLAALDDAPVLAVPESAVQTFEGRTVVFVEERAGDQATFRPRPVSIGPVQGGYAPVLSGLEEGEPVAVRGAFLLAADLGKEGAEHVH